jgi:hypothetical protein
MKLGLTLLAIGLVIIGSIGLASAIAGTHGRSHNWMVSWNGEKGSGKIETETRSVGEFDRIQIDLGANVRVHVGEPQKLTIAIDDNLLDNVTTTVHARTLEISSRKSFSTDNDCTAEIWVPSLESIECNGSGEIEVRGLNGDNFSYELNGSGDFNAYGKVDQLDISVNGSGNVDTRRLVAQEAKIDISGSGDVKVNAKKTLDVEISGSGSLEYVGTPEHISQSISGSGSVDQGKSI